MKEIVQRLQGIQMRLLDKTAVCVQTSETFASICIFDKEGEAHTFFFLEDIGCVDEEDMNKLIKEIEK